MPTNFGSVLCYAVIALLSTPCESGTPSGGIIVESCVQITALTLVSTPASAKVDLTSNNDATPKRIETLAYATNTYTAPASPYCFTTDNSNLATGQRMYGKISVQFQVYDATAPSNILLAVSAFFPDRTAAMGKGKGQANGDLFLSDSKGVNGVGNITYDIWHRLRVGTGSTGYVSLSNRNWMIRNQKTGNPCFVWWSLCFFADVSDYASLTAGGCDLQPNVIQGWPSDPTTLITQYNNPGTTWPAAPTRTLYDGTCWWPHSQSVNVDLHSNTAMGYFTAIRIGLSSAPSSATGLPDATSVYDNGPRFLSVAFGDSGYGTYLGEETFGLHFVVDLTTVDSASNPGEMVIVNMFDLIRDTELTQTSLRLSEISGGHLYYYWNDGLLWSGWYDGFQNNLGSGAVQVPDSGNTMTYRTFGSFGVSIGEEGIVQYTIDSSQLNLAACRVLFGTSSTVSWEYDYNAAGFSSCCFNYTFACTNHPNPSTGLYLPLMSYFLWAQHSGGQTATWCSNYLSITAPGGDIATCSITGPGTADNANACAANAGSRCRVFDYVSSSFKKFHQWSTVPRFSCTVPVDTRSQSPSTAPTTATPSSTPSASPSSAPSRSPSGIPTKAPATSQPSKTPTSGPSSSSPSGSPTKAPVTSQPSSGPTSTPSKSPSGTPSGSPSGSPTIQPSKSPTGTPTAAPSHSPATPNPTGTPSVKPTSAPNTAQKGTVVTPAFTDTTEFYYVIGGLIVLVICLVCIIGFLWGKRSEQEKKPLDIIEIGTIPSPMKKSESKPVDSSSDSLEIENGALDRPVRVAMDADQESSSDRGVDEDMYDYPKPVDVTPEGPVSEEGYVTTGLPGPHETPEGFGVGDPHVTQRTMGEASVPLGAEIQRMDTTESDVYGPGPFDVNSGSIASAAPSQSVASISAEPLPPPIQVDLSSLPSPPRMAGNSALSDITSTDSLYSQPRIRNDTDAVGDAHVVMGLEPTETDYGDTR